MKDKGRKKKTGLTGKTPLVRLREWYESKRLVLHFSLIFGVLMVAFYALTTGPGYDRFLAEYLNASARLSGMVVNCLGQHTIVSGLTLESSKFAFTVQRGCDAVEPSYFFAVAVLAFPSRFSRKVLGVLLGVTLLNLLNILRIGSLFLIGSYAPAQFNLAHIEIWPAAFIILSILLWLGWVAWSQQDHAKS